MRSVSGLLSICTVEYGGHRHGKHEGGAMSLKSRVDQLEKQIVTSEDYSKEWERAFDGWTIEELAHYALTGEKPEGKEVGPISDRARKASIKKYEGWTDEELEQYATTGEKPESKRS